MLALEGFWTGRPQEGADAARSGIELLAGSDDEEWTFFAHFYLAVNRIQLGAVHDAADANRRAFAVAERTRSLRQAAFVAWSTGWIETILGNSEGATAACRRGTELAPDPLGQANALGFLGYAHLESGNAGDAVAALQDSIARSARFGFLPQQGWFSGWLAEAHLLIGDLHRARQSAEESVTIGRRVAFPYGIGVGLRAAGRAALAAGDATAARRALDESAEIFARISARYELARTELDRAHASHLAGNAVAARRHAITARDTMADLGLTSWIARATEMIRE